MNNFQNENFEEEKEIYEDKINNEVEAMIECYGIVNGLLDKNKNVDTNYTIIESHNKEHTHSINQVVLKKKRKIEELNDLFEENEENTDKNEDLFNFDWRSKGLN